MSSKIFKAGVGILIVAILVVGGLVALKALSPSTTENVRAAQQGNGDVPAGAIVEEPGLSSSSDGEVEINVPGDNA